MTEPTKALMPLMSLEDTQSLGAIFVKSGFFQDTTDASKAVVKILAGRELGLAPIASMMGIYIVKGKTALSANVMATKVKASGKYDYRIRKLDNTICEIEFFQRNNLASSSEWDSIGKSSFTIEDARKAGTQNLEKFPRNMLFARCMSNGVKWFCPDVSSGMVIYTPEEMGAKVDEEGNVVQPEPTDPSSFGVGESKPMPREEVDQQIEAEEKVIASPKSDKPAPAVTPITFSNETNSLVLQIHATAETQFGKYKGPAVKKESAQKLAAVVGDGLDKAYSAEDKELWRHAIYARITQNYGEHPTAIEHGEQMPAELVAAMYFRWVDPANAFRASKQAVNELAQLVAAIAKERGQMEMPLETAGAAVSQSDLPF